MSRRDRTQRETLDVRGGHAQHHVAGDSLVRRHPSRAELLTLGDLSDVRCELAYRNLAPFVRMMWPVVEPGRPLHWSWYLDAICEHLEAVTRGEIRRLLINMPPRHLKTTLVSVMWPAWEWLHNPTLRYLTASYDLELAIRDALNSRLILESGQFALLQQYVIRTYGKKKIKSASQIETLPYEDFDGDNDSAIVAFSKDQNAKSRYVNTARGHRIVAAPSAGTTGEGGDRIMVDDPHDQRKVHSDAIRQATLDWWDRSMSTRANEPKKSAWVVVMQRLREKDLTDHLLTQGGYELLCLPTMYEPDHPHRRTTCLGFQDPRTIAGELLSPEHFGPQEVIEAQRSLGTAFAGQHQQRPAPAGGSIYKKFWFRYWTVLPAKFDKVIQSWDFSFKGADGSQRIEKEIARLQELSWVVGQVWGLVDAEAYLLDEVRGKWDFLEACKRVLDLTARWPAALEKLIEAKANGPAIMSILRSQVPGLLEIEPDGGKVERAYAVQAIVQSGNVLLPISAIAPWIDKPDPDVPGDLSWIEEVTTFPHAAANDRVDSMTQALRHLKVNEVAAAKRKILAMTTM